MRIKSSILFVPALLFAACKGKLTQLIVAVSDEIFKPGAFGTIHVKFNTEHYIGFQNKYVCVFSNDPAREKVRLTVMAEISK